MFLRNYRLLLRLAAVLLLGIAFARADDATTEWSPPTPTADTKYDWIELTSGEWLKGDFRYMYDESVEFDSDILGVLTIDWSDIKQVRFAQPMGVRLDDRSVRRGNIKIEDKQLLFAAPDHPKDKKPETVAKSEIVSITPVAHDEWDRWELQANIGADFQRGNTNETRYTATIDATRRTPSTRLKFSYLGNYTLTDSVETANNHRVGSTFDYFLDERIYIRGFDGEYYRDPFQNLDMQVTVGAGLGYKIIDSKKVDWEIQAGPAYQYTEFETVTVGDSDTAQSPAGMFTSDFDYEITGDLDLNINYQAIVTNKASGLLTQHLVTKLEYELNSIFDVFTMLQFDRVENPQQRSDGTTPDKNDVTISFGLGVDI